MKLRQLPEDFRVEELIDLTPDKVVEAGFRLYVLEKRGVESLHALRHIAKSSNVPFKSIGYAGLKDKHAFTRQYLTVPLKYLLKELSEPNLRVIFHGFTSKGLVLGGLVGNKFSIVVRGVRKGEFEGVYRKAVSVYVPNYYDSQRFGSVVNGDFIAKHVLKGDYEGAVKLFLVGVLKTDSRIAREDKRLMASSWPDFKGLKLNTLLFSRVIDAYVKTRDWRLTYLSIPSELRNLFANALLSYLWNECVKVLLKKYVKKKFLYRIDYSVGSLLFFKKGFSKVPEFFKLGVDDVSLKVLEREGLTLESLKDFNIQERRVIIAPENFSILKPELDEVNDKGKKNFFKITISFTLPPGSYATIVLKRIFNL